MMRTVLLLLAPALLILSACKPALDLSSDITQGWGDYAWGTDRETVVEALGLESADKTTDGDLTYIQTGQVRKLGDASVAVKYVFTEDKFVGVSLRSLKTQSAADARAALTQWFGDDGSADKWSKGSVMARLSEEKDSFVVIIVDTSKIPEIQAIRDKTDHMLERANEVLEQTRDELENKIDAGSE